MKKAITIQRSITYLVFISLLLFVTSCKPDEYFLNVNVLPSGSGTVSFSPDGGIYEEGTEVTLSPIPATDYLFTSWSGPDASSVNDNKIVMSKNRDITANFQAQYSLQVNILPVGSGTVSLSPDGGIYEDGTEVTLSPVPESGFIFASWTGTDASMVNNDKIVMSKDMDIIANFEPESFIRLKTGDGLNPGEVIHFVALSKNVNYIDLEDLWGYEKTEADWYSDGGAIPFTTDYKEIDTGTGEYYVMLKASDMVIASTITVISGKQTIEIYSDDWFINVRMLDETKSTRVFEEKSRSVVIDKR